MNVLQGFTLMSALALCSIPVTVPAGEAPATSAATQRDAEKKLSDAQQRLDTAARTVAELSGQLVFRLNIDNELNNGSPPRALLGIRVDDNSNRDGARVNDVSPGGAAAEVGIKPGDLITAIADLDLTKDGNPARALIEKMNQLEPDKKVKLAVLRDGKKMSFDITPRPAPQDIFIRRQGSPVAGRWTTAVIRQGQPGRNGAGGRTDGPQGSPQGPQMIERQQLEIRRGDEIDTRFGGAELASLSDRLGSYFGVKAGVLVVRAGVDSRFKLQDGDVILAIDGREITSAQQAGRILRSYQPGEKLTLKVQRDRKVQSLEITAPGGRDPN
ncbi:MAG: PDZ domain-containing protein [Pseudomonadota bacterium]